MGWGLGLSFNPWVLPMTNSSSNSNTFAVRSEEVAQRFLQSVVILDDILSTEDNQTLEPVGQVGELVSPNFGAPISDGLQHEDDQPESSTAPFVGQDSDGNNAAAGGSRDIPLLFRPLVHGFAKLGLVCAVLNPDQTELETGDIGETGVVTAARRADIVVLDWKLWDSYGTTTRDIMRGILAEENQGPRLRLLSIYTGEPGLVQITDEIKDTIDQFYDGYTLEECGQYCVTKGPIRVAIIPKQGTNAPGAPGVSEADLPKLLIKEFVSLTRGLLRNVALAGLAALREDTPRLLAKFDSNLDPAYLGHRMLLKQPADAEEHIVEALAAELAYILEHRRPGGEAALDIVEGWLTENIQNNKINTSSPSKISTMTDPVDMRIELLRKGIDGLNNMEPNKSALTKKATGIFGKDLDDANRSDRAFATLLSLRTFYPTTLPKLSLGTIVRKGQKGPGAKYFLCLQPKCDAVRLESATGFPLMPLSVVTNQNRRFTWVIPEQDDEWVYLHADPDEKPNSLIVPCFSPTEDSHGEITGQNYTDGYCFSDNEDVKYKWVAALKDEHALQISGEVSAKLGRPGPNYSEWLRRARRR